MALVTSIMIEYHEKYLDDSKSGVTRQSRKTIWRIQYHVFKSIGTAIIKNNTPLMTCLLYICGVVIEYEASDKFVRQHLGCQNSLP